MARLNTTKRTPELIERYLETLRETGLKQLSAKAVGVDPATMVTWRNNDPELDDMVLAAVIDYHELVEAEIHRRAIEGVETPVFGKEGEIGTKRTYSDRLLELHAKRHIKAYRDKQSVDHTVKGGVLVVPGMSKSSKEWEDEENG